MYSCAVSGMSNHPIGALLTATIRSAMKLIGTVGLGWSLVAQIVFQPHAVATPSVMGGLPGGRCVAGRGAAYLNDVLPNGHAGSTAWSL